MASIQAYPQAPSPALGSARSLLGFDLGSYSQAVQRREQRGVIGFGGGGSTTPKNTVGDD